MHKCGMLMPKNRLIMYGKWKLTLRVNERKFQKENNSRKSICGNFSPQAFVQTTVSIKIKTALCRFNVLNQKFPPQLQVQSDNQNQITNITIFIYY